MNIVISGSAGRLARVLIPRLLKDPTIRRIDGFDIKPTTYPDRRYHDHQLDVRECAAQKLVARADIFIHLAFVLMGGNLGRDRHNRELVREINVEASTRLFQVAVDSRVSHILFLSSAAVYGAWPDNPRLLMETHPLRPIPGFTYAEDKITVENALDEIERWYPASRITRLRPHAIVGPHAHPLLNQVLRGPFYPRSRALTQCVWEDDVIQAVVLVIKKEMSGIFNLAAQPAMSLYDMLGLHRHLRLPLKPAAALHRLLWKVTPAVGEPGWVESTRYSLALDTRRAQEILCWEPQLNTPTCVERAYQLNTV